MPNHIAAHMYQLRDKEVAVLANQSSITVKDLDKLERTGLFRVADEFFELCDEGACQYLLEYPHHFVRAAATVSEDRMQAKKA